MDQEAFEHLVEDFCALRQQDYGTPLEVRTDLKKIIAQLDSVYWERTEEILTGVHRKGDEKLVFDKYQRFCIDAGMVDERLLGERSARIKVELAKELYADGAPNHYYLSQWLVERYRAFIALGGMQTAPGGAEAAPGGPAADSAVPDPETAALVGRARATRVKIYAALHSFLENLPGIPPQLVETLCTGRLDDHLAGLEIRARGPGASPPQEQYEKLLHVRRTALDMARTRCSHEKQLALFDALEQLDETVRQARARGAEAQSAVAAVATAEAPTERRETSQRARLEFLVGEVKLVKSILKLGATGSGITRTHSVLLSDEARLTKSDLAAILTNLQEADPRLPGLPDMLIAPYKGTGFFEWDRNTIFVPVLSVKSPEESIVNGLGNYRIMIDNLQNKGRLKNAYERNFGRADFRNAFLRDYRNWVLGIGKGYRGALDPERFGFFKDWLGPHADRLFSTGELFNITPNRHREIQKQARGRVNRGEGEFQDHYNLALLYWKDSRPQDSMDQMARAVKLNPVDGRSLFILGYLCRTLGIQDKAAAAFRECMNVAPNTIWQVYANEHLGKMS